MNQKTFLWSRHVNRHENRSHDCWNLGNVLRSRMKTSVVGKKEKVNQDYLIHVSWVTVSHLTNRRVLSLSLT